MVLARASQSVITFADAIQVKDLGPGAIAATATGGLNVMGLVILTMGTAVFGNWVLIGGHLGAPAMGIDGAAVSNVIATWLGFAFLVIAWWRGWGGAPHGTRPLGLSRRELRRVIRFGLPNGFNWFL